MPKRGDLGLHLVQNDAADGIFGEADFTDVETAEAGLDQME